MRYLSYTLQCVSCVCVLTITGCMVGPNFQPQVSVPSAWTGTIASANGISMQTDLENISNFEQLSVNYT